MMKSFPKNRGGADTVGVVISKDDDGFLVDVGLLESFGGKVE